MENSGIPLCFRCFKGIDDPDAFNLSLIMEGISYVHNLFKDKKCQLIFLAFQTKLAISKSDSHKEPFFILTNGNTRDAIKHYGYRFGSIEFIFKNQKSNGFYLECTKMRNIHAFTTLFTLVCVAILWLTILGADYSKNKNHFKNCFKIKYSKKNGSNHKRTFSLFNTGLFFFNLAFESTKYIVLKCNFLLYDI